MSNKAIRDREGAIWSRLFPRHNLSVAGARYFLELEFPAEDKLRMKELAAKARDGVLSNTERAEIDDYERAGSVLGILKSQARKRLKRASAPNDSRR